MCASEALGRDVNHLEVAAPEGSYARFLFLEIYRTVDESGRKISGLTSVHLIFHQRYERRDNNGRALAHERGQLAAERFAAARRHHDNGIVPGEYRAYDFALALAEILEAEMCMERSEGVFDSRHKKSDR